MEKKDKFGKLCKEKMVDEIVTGMRARPNIFITSYMGSSVQDLEQLRKGLKKNQSKYVVVKNSILKVVFDKIKLPDEKSKVDGGMGISFSGEDIVATCKTLVTFAKDHEKFKIKGAVIDGKSIDNEKIKRLAQLPPRIVLLTQVVVGMKSPITGFVNTLAGVLRKFVYVIDAIKTARQGPADAPGNAEPRV